MNVDVYNLIKKGEFVIQGNGSFFSETKIFESENRWDPCLHQRS